jgi:hypothetical protein
MNQIISHIKCLASGLTQYFSLAAFFGLMQEEGSWP